MIITEAIRDGEFLKLKTNSPDSFKLVYGFKPGEYEITKAKKKRSNDANAYCWELCEKIAKSISQTKENIYRDAIREVGIYTPLPVREDATNEFARIWAAHGIGWVLDVIDDCKKMPGYKLCYAYQGSSTYDTAQMSRLIDELIQNCQSMGIETRPDEEIKSMLEVWGEKPIKQPR